MAWSELIDRGVEWSLCVWAQTLVSRAVLVFPLMTQSESAACVCGVCRSWGSTGCDCALPSIAQSEVTDRGVWQGVSPRASGCDCVSSHGTVWECSMCVWRASGCDCVSSHGTVWECSMCVWHVLVRRFLGPRLCSSLHGTVWGDRQRSMASRKLLYLGLWLCLPPWHQKKTGKRLFLKRRARCEPRRETNSVREKLQRTWKWSAIYAERGPFPKKRLNWRDQVTRQ